MGKKTNLNRLNGINPLSYMGTNPYTPPDLLIQQRDPTDNDNEYQIGTIWTTQIPEKVWMLINLTGGQATWILLYPTSGSGAEEFVTDTGNIATALNGVINDLGDGNLIQTDAPGNNNTITTTLLNGSDGQLIVGGGTQPKWADLHGVNVVTTLTGPNLLYVGLTNGTDGQVVIGGGLAPTWANLTAGNGITITNAANGITISTTGGNDGVITTAFTTPGTYSWTPNSNTQYVTVYLWGAGGGGGSGSFNPSVSSFAGPGNGGGGGGGGGSIYKLSAPILAFGTGSQTVIVGAGGAGGAAVSGGFSNDGTDGGDSQFGFFVANGGSGGGGGNGLNSLASGGAGGSAGTDFTISSSASNAGGSGGKNLVWGNSGFPQPGGNGLGGLFYTMSAGGGGGSGSAALLANCFDGADGGAPFSLTPAAGGTAGTDMTVDGAAGSSAAPAQGPYISGGGGGGAGQTVGMGTRGGDGGAGGFPGSGGGGGGGCDSGSGTRTGAGGDGADGLVLVFEFTGSYTVVP